MAEASPIKRHKGKFVLLAVALALAAYVVIAKLGIAWFDATRNEPGAAQAVIDAERASVQWLTYLSRSGRPDTEEGKRAAEELARAAEAREADNNEQAQRAYLAAWQAYVSAFRAEAEETRKLWETHVASPWRDKLKDRFPFDAKATDTADAAALARMIQPESGELWQHRTRFEAMAAVQMPGTAFVAEKDLTAFIRAAEALRDALFKEGKPLSFDDRKATLARANFSDFVVPKD